LPKIDYGANAGGMTDLVQAVGQRTAHEDIARKQRLGYPLEHSSNRPLLAAQPGIEHFQGQILSQVRGGDVFIFGLGSRAIPAWRDFRNPHRVNTIRDRAQFARSHTGIVGTDVAKTK
jgi:hypothetical protein